MSNLPGDGRFVSSAGTSSSNDSFTFATFEVDGLGGGRLQRQNSPIHDRIYARNKASAISINIIKHDPLSCNIAKAGSVVIKRLLAISLRKN
jgi:hypothetical protein